MEYKHSLRKLFLGLFLFYFIVYIVGLFINVLFIKDQPLKIFTENMDIWISLLSKDLIIGLAILLVGSLIIQWNYKCKIIDGVLYGRNSMGILLKLTTTDIAKVKIYNIPLMPLVKFKLKSQYWSVWVVKSAYEDFV